MRESHACNRGQYIGLSGPRAKTSYCGVAPNDSRGMQCNTSFGPSARGIGDRPFSKAMTLSVLNAAIFSVTAFANTKAFRRSVTARSYFPLEVRPPNLLSPLKITRLLPDHV